MNTSKEPGETLKSLSAKEIKQIEQKSIKKHISKLLKEVDACLNKLDKLNEQKENTQNDKIQNNRPNLYTQSTD